MAEPSRVRVGALRATLVALLERLDFPSDDAGRIADVLIESELRGYEDHGVYMLTFLLGWVRGGNVNPRATIRVVDETDSTILFDADRASGVLGATQAMTWCVERARSRRGIALAGLRNSSHFVAAGIYAEMAAEAGLVGFARPNASPLVAPHGGRAGRLRHQPRPMRSQPAAVSRSSSTSRPARPRPPSSTWPSAMGGLRRPARFSTRRGSRPTIRARCGAAARSFRWAARRQGTRASGWRWSSTCWPAC